MNPHDILIEKTCVMLTMQDEMNSHVDADWRAREREWYRAIWIECAELMDHYGGWKWWKHSTPDMPQVVLEIVDIWHFGLSLRIEAGAATQATATTIVDEWLAPPASSGFLAEVERLAVAALYEQRFAVGSVANLFALCGRDFDELYRAYIAKNVLNMFRQNHGYRSGEYLKEWNGREDNEVLVDVMASLDSNAAGFRADIYVALEGRYALVKAAVEGR